MGKSKQCKEIEFSAGQVARWQNSNEFYRAFFKVLGVHGCTHREAFDLINDKYQDLIGKPRYSSFESFKQMKHRWSRKR